MRKLSLLLVLLSLGGLGGFAAGQEMYGGILFSRFRQFQIPFQLGPNDQRLKQVQLFVSTDQGKTWQPAATSPPDQKKFRFITDRDGYFWFTVQSLDLDGKLYPPTLDNVQPSLKVVVDTQPPTVSVQPLTPRGNDVGVSWEVRDDNLDLALPDAMRLEYRPAASPNWVPLSISTSAHQHYWNPQSQANLEVRLRARDRAGNWGEATTTVSVQGPATGSFVPAQPGVVEPASPSSPNIDVLNPPAEHERKYVNSKRISLNYELKEVGPSGVSSVELWFTLDGRSWNRYPLKFGDDPNQKSISFDVAGEGLYGISLVAKSGVGLGERPPQIGDRPQIWIEVDTTKPVVQLHGVQVGQGLDKGKVMISWNARDKNIQREPITISYAQQQAGPWTPIVQKLANTGRYVWTIPDGIPYQFYVKVEAVDHAGNIGEAVTPDMIRVDLSLPKVRILTVEPGGK